MEIDRVKVPGEGYCKIVEGTSVTKVKVIAGKGTRTEFRNASRLAIRHGGYPDDWQKVRGQVFLWRRDEKKSAEIHWDQEERIGVFNFKFKGWIEK